MNVDDQMPEELEMTDSQPELPEKPEQPRHPERHPFQFDGTGREFFGIWIINVLLSIVTLGIYSAWAKVRTNRYLYGNTHVAGGHFDYHAEPLVILRGRIIAIVLLIIYAFASELLPIVGALLGLAFIIAIPFVVVRALTFNARVSSWRNIRFNFEGDVGEAFGAYFGWPIVGMFSAGIMLPYAWFKKAEFGVDNHRLGRTAFKLDALPRDFYVIALILIVISIAIMVAIGFAGGALAPLFSAFDGEDEEAAAQASMILVPAMLFVYFAAFSLFSALRFKTVYNNLELDQNHISSSVNIGRYVWIALTNALLMALTLGLYYPWAKVRMTRYLIESLELSAINIDEFVAAETEDQSAFGEEFGEAFDMGIGV